MRHDPMFGIRLTATSLLFGLAAAGSSACDCGYHLTSVGKTTLTITSPASMSQYAASDSFDYTASATNSVGIKTVSLYAGPVSNATGGADCAGNTNCASGLVCTEAHTCMAAAVKSCTSSSPSDNSETCSSTFSIAAHEADIVQNKITLTAIAVDSREQVTSATLVVDMKPTGNPAIVFTQPMATSGGTPPTADVSGTGPVSVTVSSPLPLSSVVITYGNGMTLASWTSNVTGTVFTQSIPWETMPGVGTYTLTGTVTDNQNNTATAQLIVTVERLGCTADSDCTNGERCCSQDGSCNPTVLTGADCDCDNPCPSNQGCFPGICGASPQKCFDGCFPGSTSGAGQKPNPCPDINGQPAFCIALPASQVTTQNQGGSCVPGDNCSVTMQNCPMMPLDRSQPVGASNPLIAYNCLPVFPGVNGCFPAGTIMQGGANCDQMCGTEGSGVAAVQDNCAVGYGCVQPVDATGTPLGPATCEAQCDNPSFTAHTNVCASNPKDICEGVYQAYGSQMVDFTSGTCCIKSLGSCTSATASECCSGTCTIGLCE